MGRLLVLAVFVSGCSATGVVTADPCVDSAAYKCRSVYTNAPGFGLQVSMIRSADPDIETVANITPEKFGYSVTLPTDGADLFIADKDGGVACHLVGDVFVDWPVDSNAWTVTASGVCKSGNLAGKTVNISVSGSSFR